nr:MAG: hypothetical protein [Porcellio scaber clopovirus]
MASVDLIIYDVKFLDEINVRHSILEFKSSISYTEGETGIKRELLLNDDDGGKNSIRLNKEAYLYPVLKKTQFEESLNIISRLDEYLYFDCDPEELKDTLKMELKLSNNTCLEMDLNIVIQTNIGLSTLLKKIFKQWEIQMGVIFILAQEIKGMKYKKYEKVKQCFKVIDILVKENVKSQFRELQSITNSNLTSVEITLKELELRRLIFECDDFIKGFFKTFLTSDGNKIVKACCESDEFILKMFKTYCISDGNKNAN